MSTTLVGTPRHAPNLSQDAQPPSWRDRLAAWAVKGALFLMALAIGGSLYEHLVVDPVWPGNVPLIQPERGGVDRKVFWVPLHGALTVLFPVALWACWRNPAARRWALVALGSYLVMR